MTTKKWRLFVTPLSGGAPLHQLDVEATNWMGALRASRKELGEEGGMPPGASCSVAPDGAVTILDAASRRKFVLTPTTVSVPAPGPVQPSPVAAAPAAVKAEAAPSAPAHAEPQSPSKKKKFQTVAYMPGTSAAGLTDATQPSAAAPVVAAAPVAAAPQATAQPPQPAPAAQPVAGARRARTPTPVDTSQLELLFTRDEDPSAQNPLTYRERAYYVPRGMSVTEAEAALRFTLADLQNQTRAAARGRFVNLAAFDHRWTEQPERPPLIVLEWRDWRGEPSVDYPATERAPSIAPGHDTGDADERIASVFESLHELAHLRSPAQGLDFVVKLLEQAVASAAISGCLYDINTDELRFVAVTGPGAEAKQGQATPRGAGLFGLAGRLEHAALVFPDARVHPSFSPATDGREGLEVHNMMLRPVVHEGQLLAMLQLINRVGVPFSTADVHVVNYIADRLGEFLREARVRPAT